VAAWAIDIEVAWVVNIEVVWAAGTVAE